MTLWNEVQSNFNVDDETINFGTRIITENNGSLYEACTIATIKSFDKVDQQPNVLASLQHSKFCIAVDKSITIFKDETCDEIVCNISFPSMITCYCISKDGFFLFVVLATRILYCLHLLHGKVIFTKTIPDNQNDIIKIFLKEQDEREEAFVILITNTGAIYRFSKFYSKALKLAFADEKDKITVAERENIAENIQCSQLFEGFTSLKFLNATINTLSKELSITMVGTNSIYTWPDKQLSEFRNIFSFGYKKIIPLNGSRKMLCLRTNNILSIMCPNTLLGLKICDDPVYDFTVIQHDDNDDQYEILFLTKSEHNPIACTLYLISYPEFEQKLEINVSANTYLLDILYASNNIIYIEGITTENGIIDTFRIKTISESIPEMRLARLLRKKQFEAAEAFAERLGLSMESIYFSKAALFIEQLGLSAKSASHSANVDELINILDKIQDMQYVTECCNKALISNSTQMKQIYLYTRQRIMQNMKRENIDDPLNASLSLINDALHRLETFQILQDIETDTALSNDDAVTKEWIRFSQINLLKECTTRLRMGQLESASLIWTRHLPHIAKFVSMQTVRNIFAILPEDMAPSRLWCWFTHFIPTLLSLLPDAMDEIVSWGLKKLKCLEISHRTEWPDIGIDFAKKFIRLLEVEDSQHSASFQEYRYKNSALKQFMLLLQALSDIQQLKITYRLKIPLNTYVGSPVEAIYTLLNKIHLDEISNFVNAFLKQYMLNNNLQNDFVLCAYIQKTISSNSWWFDEEVAWERRITIVTNLIYDVEKRLEQTLAILKKASVPWSPTIATLAETSSNFDHSLSAKIKIECNYVSIKLVLKKYGYAAIGINNKLISLIIKEDRDSMINDIEVLTKNDQQLRQNSYCRCINVRLNEGNLQKAMDVIHHLENNISNALYCYEGIVNYIVASFSFQNVTTSLICHMEILGYLEFKIRNLLAQSNVCSFRCNNIINMIKDLRSLYTLKKDYKIDISLKNYRMQKLLVLKNYITKSLPSMMENNLSEVYKTVIKITELLGVEKSYATLFLLEQVKDINVMQQLASDLNFNDLNFISDEFKNTKKICLLALQHTAVNINTVKVVKNLSASLLESCQDRDLQSALILYTCTSVCSSLSLQYSDMKQEITPQSSWKLYTIYKDQAISLDQRLFAFFKDAIFLCLYYSGQIDDNEITNYNKRMDQLLNNFLENIRKMQLQHNDYSLLQIFKTFYFIYCSMAVRNESVLTEMKSILSQLLMNLLKKLCTGRLFDLQLGLSCLFMLSKQEARNWLSIDCTSFHVDGWYSTISTLGYEYSHLEKNKSLMQKFKDYKLLHIWAQRLSQYSIVYKEVFVNNALSKREILQQIINSNKENMIPLLKDYCCNFGFDFNDCLWHYLKIILETWNPTITVSNTSPNKELHICTDEVHELRKKCNAIVAQMEDKSVLKQRISTLWHHISFYHYEVFIILMDLVGDKNMEKRNYLCFLENYIRNGSPTSMEHDEWIQLNPGHSTLPPIAQWRLPFLLKVDIWKIITPELNLKTYEKWLDIAPVLNLEIHLVCTLAIKGEVTYVWKNSTAKSQNAWSLYPKNGTLLENIKRCIQKITDSNGFYYGTAALYYVVNHTPPGADRVAAVKECYEYAQLAAQNSTKFEEGMLEKIKSKYLRFTSEHILRTYGLEKDKYLALIDNPCKLVYELYNDESIPLRYQIATNYRPNINAAVNKLGELFSLNTTKLRMDLLQEWLQSNVRYTELYQSFTETVSALKESNQNTDCEDNLLRICYVIEYGDTDLFAQFLINIGFGDDKTEYNYDVRYRVLRVLQTVVDTATLEELTKRDICTFKKYINSLHYVGKLESLGLCYSIETFERCCKHELVQILWTRLRHLPYALSVITQICIEFKLYDIIVWNNTLSQMTKLRMENELKKVLLQLRNESAIVCCDGYKMGWQLIISEPFREMNVNSSPEQINNCIEAICLLYSCPMPHELEFTAIVQNSFQCKQAHLAAALLPFLNDSEKQFVLEMINQQCEIAKLEEDLHHLSAKGVLTVACSLIIIKKFIS